MEEDQGKERVVRLFRNDRNQVVRNPRDFEMAGSRAIIRKEGDRLIPEPTRVRIKIPPILLFRHESAPDGNLAPAPEDAEKTEEEPVIRCRQCGHAITLPDARMEKDGRHRHVFGNPAGYIYEIDCFSIAPGCALEGIPTTEFTWFAGCAWRFALCGSCGVHLGWEYGGASGRFFGLIASLLIES